MHDTRALNIVCPHCAAINRAPEAKLVAGARPNCGSCHEPLFTGEPVEVATAAAFDRHVTHDQIPILVDFWAEWCGPCKMIAPILDEIADEYAGKLKVAKLNIDDNQDTPAKYGIRGIPTLMIFKNGNVEATQVGAVSKSQLTQLIDRAIA